MQPVTSDIASVSFVTSTPQVSPPAPIAIWSTTVPTPEPDFPMLAQHP